MKAKHYQELFTGKLRGDLSPAENELLNHHLEGCASCRMKFAETQQLWADMEMLAAIPEPSPMLKAGFEDMLNRYQQQAEREKHRQAR